QGVSLLKSMGEDEDDDDDDKNISVENEEEKRAIGPPEMPDRYLFSLDLRSFEDPKVYVDEVKRIAKECSIELVPLTGLHGVEVKAVQLKQGNGGRGLAVLGEPKETRWYPVIDYSRCTNCLECIDFCLFGVYGIDHKERILVENQDNCKRGCPA